MTRSLSLDPHGKSYSALILTLVIEVDEANVSLLREAGRQPVEETNER